MTGDNVYPCGVKSASDPKWSVVRPLSALGIPYRVMNVCTGEIKCLLTEGFENANLEPQNVTYVDNTDEMIWWSERSGWGHFYLYDRAGKLNNLITFGDYRASAIVAMDAKNLLVYFRGNAREPKRLWSL